MEINHFQSVITLVKFAPLIFQSSIKKIVAALRSMIMIALIHLTLNSSEYNTWQIDSFIVTFRNDVTAGDNLLHVPF